VTLAVRSPNGTSRLPRPYEIDQVQCLKWPDILHYSREYQSAVITGLDVGGYPWSWRCRPSPDEAEKTLRLAFPNGIAPTDVRAPGPACLLWHRHDDRLWQLHSFAVRGALIQDEVGWALRPEQFIPGVGIGGWRSYLRFLVNGRRTTRRYLEARNLPRPKLDWYEWQEILI